VSIAQVVDNFRVRNWRGRPLACLVSPSDISLYLSGFRQRNNEINASLFVCLCCHGVRALNWTCPISQFGTTECRVSAFLWMLRVMSRDWVVIVFIEHFITTGTYNNFTDIYTLQITVLQHTWSLLILHYPLLGSGFQWRIFLSKSKLLYDWRFTGSQFVLASSPLRPTWDFFPNWIFAVIVLM
jgi:hypothetical protein